MKRVSDTMWELAGYAVWLVGSAMFAVSSFRADDTISFVASLLFFFGIIAVMVPMVRRARNQPSS